MPAEPALKRHSARGVPRERPPEWWPALFDAVPDASIYLSPEWLQTWRETHGGPFEEEWLHWEEGGRIVAGCLLARHRIKRHGVPMQTIFVNASGEVGERAPLAEFNDVLALPEYRTRVAADFASHLARQSWDCLMLWGYDGGSTLALGLAALPAALVRAEARPAPYVDLAALGGKPFMATMSGSTASQIRRSQRLYEERSGPLSVTVAASADEAIAFLDSLTSLHGARWQSKGEEGSFASPARMEFHRRLIRRLWDRGAVEMVRVRAGDTDIGYLYNFRARGKVYSFQSGFAYEEDARYKPGLVSHVLAIDQAARRGEREYDFLAGDSRYKRSLGKNLRTLHWTVVYRDHAWMRLLVLAWKARNLFRGKEGEP